MLLQANRKQLIRIWLAWVRIGSKRNPTTKVRKSARYHEQVNQRTSGQINQNGKNIASHYCYVIPSFSFTFGVRSGGKLDLRDNRTSRRPTRNSWTEKNKKKDELNRNGWDNRNLEQGDVRFTFRFVVHFGGVFLKACFVFREHGM
jgi:hypothetical protein